MDIAFTLTALLLAPIGVVLELYLGRKHGLKLYAFGDTVVNLLGGLFEETILLAVGALLLVPYAYVESHWAPKQWQADSPWSWLIAFFAIDFVYYWWHRYAHQVNFMWAWHSTHHQSSQFNLSVALRQELGTTEWLAYLPIALLGVDPKVFVSVYTLTQIYQLPVHTRMVGKLGWLEKVVNTPSSHRVHHGCDEQYIDKNFGAVLMIWDRLFGTYQAETTEPTYGLVQPWQRHDIFTSYFGYSLALLKASVLEQRGWNRLRIWFASPNWQKVQAQPETQAPSGKAALLSRDLFGITAGAAFVLLAGLYLQSEYESLAQASARTALSAVGLVAVACLGITRLLERSSRRFA